MNGLEFDYQEKIWGTHELRLLPWYIQSLKLRYWLEDLEGIRGRVLDVGCGGGNMARALKRYRPDLEVWGVDLSPRALQSANFPSNGTSLLAASAEKLPFPDQFFDCVAMFDVLEHVPEPNAVLLEIRRLLRGGGLFHLFLPLEKQPFTIYALLHRMGWRAKEEHCGHVHAYSHKEAKQLLKSSGFSVGDIRWSFHPFFAAVDVAYFSMLSMTGKKAATSVEGYVHGGGCGLSRRLVGLTNAILVSLGYYESRLLRRVPGGGGHYEMVKVAQPTCGNNAGRDNARTEVQAPPGGQP